MKQPPPTDPRQASLFDPPQPKGRVLDLRPHRKRGSPGPTRTETQGRDDALDLLEEKRSELIRIARNIAIEICQQRGRVTSIEVFAQMRAQGYDMPLDNTDPRWMGAVFRGGSIWERAGFEQTGSHKRPVAIWVLKDSVNSLI